MSKFRSCSYLNCQNIKDGNSQGTKVKFYSFPREVLLCEQWVIACQNPSLLNIRVKTLSERRYVCSEHFNYYDFINPLRRNKRLKNVAVPVHSETTKFKKSELYLDDEKFLISEKQSLKCRKLTFRKSSKRLNSIHKSKNYEAVSISFDRLHDNFNVKGDCWEELSKSPIRDGSYFNSNSSSVSEEISSLPVKRILNFTKYPYMKSFLTEEWEILHNRENGGEEEEEDFDDGSCYVPVSDLWESFQSFLERKGYSKSVCNKAIFGKLLSQCGVEKVKKEFLGKPFHFYFPLRPISDEANSLMDPLSSRSSSGSSSSTPSYHKDLVSPQRLMNITENLCPLIRPISPAPSEDGSCEDGTGDSHISEINIPTTSANNSHGGGTILEKREEGEYKHHYYMVMGSDSRAEGGGSIPVEGMTQTSIKINVNPTETTTTATFVFAEDVLSGVSTSNDYKTSEVSTVARNTKRPSDAIESQSNDVVTRKYKKILPKNEDSNAVANALSSSKAYTVVKKETDSEEVILSLSGLSINKLEKTPKGSPTAKTTILYLDNNLLHTLPTIDSYTKLNTLSLANNLIDSFIWFGRLTSLKTLNLSRNKISDIDGLWKLWHLVNVDLSGNSIRVLRYQTNDPKPILERLDISKNQINTIEDISSLTKLKELLLHKNDIRTLSQCRKYLPKSLRKLTLAENSIVSLGDVSELSELENLQELTLKQNYCVNALQLVDSRGNILGAPLSFDYRPFVITWCPSIVVLDDIMVDNTEREKAQWMISGGKLKEISMEKHFDLVTYLSEACPLSSEKDERRGETQKSHSQNSSSTISEINLEDQLPLVKLVDEKKNGMADGTSLKRWSKKYGGESIKDELSSLRKSECSWEVPCKHYIELIEERAKNYKLKRKCEHLEARNETLCERISLLETAMAQNGFNAEDLFVKIEMDEERSC